MRKLIIAALFMSAVSVAHAEQIDQIDGDVVTLTDGTQLQSYGNVNMGDEVSPADEDEGTYVDDNTGADLEDY